MFAKIARERKSKITVSESRVYPKSVKNMMFELFKWALAIIVGFLILFPLWWIFVSSITPSGELFSNPIKYWPENPTLESYRYLIENAGLFRKIWDTAVIVGLSISIGMIVSVMAAFSFARFKSRGLSLAVIFLLGSMLIPDVVTARPLYDFLRYVQLYDTYTGLIILYISSIIPFSILILQSFLSDIPASIEEAALIDGCSFFQSLFYVTLPILKPAIATVCIVNFILCLNNFFTPLFYSNGISVLSTAITQLPLRDNMYAVPWDLVSAMGFIIILPITIFVGVFQRQIMEGIMAGGVKG
ncbi:carbohydrate ABC transporter permease [Bacillus sp. FJAT-50079]|uniref:carbohydrate ABC transporter permease n=1 Tax=Bacillus sp. FJAT-50079 TaxID=2833577 RepID=UPI001BC9AFCE|nr:carbohydrate ABC transporter permease [Bacillus sp. FJAT-50079]MBS4206576.1 carbohydrate ABC transporter permease [Bacillus sp. FJAT-50079]